MSDPGMVTKSLDRIHGLDEEALKALKVFRFQPATGDGVPVPVLVMFVLEFNLRSGPAAPR